LAESKKIDCVIDLKRFHHLSSGSEHKEIFITVFWAKQLFHIKIDFKMEILIGDFWARNYAKFPNGQIFKRGCTYFSLFIIFLV